ncbi:MAG: hypothetical protein KC933_21085 [Myxococcales bacterium]|nr:hypothetical protein [Myxococcales bacterium]
MNAPMTELFSRASAYSGGPPDANLREATAHFLGAVGETPALATEAADAMGDLPPEGAGWVSIVLGAAVEGGADAERSVGGILRVLKAWLDALPASGTDDELTPEQRALVDALPPLCQGLVAHLARLPERRAELRRDAAFMDRLDAASFHSYGLGWVHEAALRQSGALILLHAESGRALRLRYSNVANCFHLFSLIQCAVGTRLPGGKQPNLHFAALARGEEHGEGYDEAWWHYSTPAPKAEIGASIWGEASVASIPRVDDVQVIVVWPTLMGSRSWDTGFFGPQLMALPPDVVVEAELDEREAAEWMRRLVTE